MEEKALTPKEPDLPTDQKEPAYGITVSDLDISAKTEQVCLKCKQCGVEQHMTLAEYFKRQKKEGLLRCNLCPDRPVLFFYKVDLHRIMMAGFNKQRERMMISKKGMTRRLELIEESRDRQEQIEEK